MYPVVRSYDEQEFDNMSEESEKKQKTIIKKSLRPVRAGQKSCRMHLKNPDSEVAEDSPDKRI